MPALLGGSFKTRLFYLISELLDFLCKTWQYTLFFQLQHSQPQWKGTFEILKTISHRLFCNRHESYCSRTFEKIVLGAADYTYTP